MKHLKIQMFEIQNPKNTPLIAVCKYAKFTSWEHLMHVLNKFRKTKSQTRHWVHTDISIDFQKPPFSA